MKKLAVISFILLCSSEFNLRSMGNRSGAVYKFKGSVYSLDTATMYNPVASQCDSDPLVTASMLKIKPWKASKQKYVALSRDMLKRWGGPFDLKDSVVISGAGHKDGIYIVADVMNKRFKRKVDFLETVGTKIYRFTNIKIRKK